MDRYDPYTDKFLRDTQYDILSTNLAEVGTDCISRQAIDKFVDGLEEIFADLRERHIDDSVCGLCEYDGAYIGQSGDWCNECPGFDKDDCFKLSDKTRKEWTEEIIKALPPAQPEPCDDEWCTDCKEYDKERHCCPRWNKVIRQALADAQPERKKGKWIEYEQEFMLEEPLKTVQKTVSECSVCTAKIAGMVGIMNYCPNCGADMRGERDG